MRGEHCLEGQRLRAILLGDGTAGPIEVRLGRRLVRLLSPESEQGRALLDAGRVDLVGPDGERLGPISIQEARRHLRERLERALQSPEREGGQPPRFGHA